MYGSGFSQIKTETSDRNQINLKFCIILHTITTQIEAHGLI